MQRANYSLAVQAPEYRLQTPRVNHRPGDHLNSTHKLQPHEWRTNFYQHLKTTKTQIHYWTQAQCQESTVRWACRCCCMSEMLNTELRLRMKANTRLMFEPLNADCGFAQTPKFAAAGSFTQIDPIVCTARKTHTDTNKSPSDICQHVRFRSVQLLPDGHSECVWVCVSGCIAVGTKLDDQF